jgi:hypothetical protein
MNLKELREHGGFVSAKPVKTSVTWKRTDDLSGESKEITFDVYIRKLSFGMIEETMTTPDKRSRNALLISEAVGLGKDGKDRMTYAEAYQLQPSLARELYIAVAKANALPTPKKDDAEETEDPKDLAH